MSYIKGQDIDLTVVVDDLDIIKLYMHRIKESLLTLKPRPTILTRSIFDLENEKSTIRCRKVLFLISSATQSLETKVDSWCKQLPLINGNSKNVLIVCTGKEPENSQETYDGKCIIRLENLARISSWWPHVLKFLYGENLCCVRFGRSDFFMLNLCSSDGEACKLFDRIADILDETEFTKGTNEETVESVIAILNNPTDLNIERKLLTLKKQCERRKQSLHILCTQDNTKQLYSYTDSAYNREDILKFLLWLHIDLGLLSAHRKDLQTRIQQNCCTFMILLLKVAGVVLLLAVGVPVVLAIVCVGVAVLAILCALIVVGLVLQFVLNILTCGILVDNKR